MNLPLPSPAPLPPDSPQGHDGPLGFHGNPKESERPTRRPLVLFDRIRFILLFVVVFVVLVITEVGDNPLLSVGDAVRHGVRANWWMLVLIALEVIRQVHYWVSEQSAAYHRSWQGTWKQFAGAREKLPPLLRYRLARIARIVVLLTLLAIVLGKVTGEAPFTALFKAPAMVVSALPAILQVLLIMMVAVGQFVAIFWYLSRGGVETYMPDEINTRFSDVWGQDNVLHRVKENVALLEKPELVEAKGGQVPRGILLWGPPGTGKTLIAKAVAGETGKPFVFVEPSSFNQMFVGVGAMKVKALYKKLRKLALRYGGVIVFFDEADVLGSRSTSSGGFGGLGGAGGHVTGQECGGFGYLSERAQLHVMRASAPAASPAQPTPFIMGGMGGGGGMGVLQPLLTEMSGMEKPRGLVNRIRKLLGLRPVPPPLYRILTIMATNLPDALDQALLRPGRIDRIYKVGYPPLEGRIQTYDGYLRKVKHELSEEQVRLFALTSGQASGAQIESFVNEALILAIKDGRDTITWNDLVLAKFHRRFGLPDQHQYTDRDRHSVAIHEAGHAIAFYRLDYTSIIDVANIEKRGQVGGFVAPAPLEDSEKDWTHNLEINIKVSLASRAAERLFFGENSSGVGGDMNSATMLAMLMLGNWAMGDFLASHGATFEALEPSQPTSVPDRAVHDRPFGGRVEVQLKKLYDEVYVLMEQNRTELLCLAHALEVHGALSGSDVEAVINRTEGPMVDGRVYADPGFLLELDSYHAEVLAKLRERGPVEIRLPRRDPAPPLALAAYQNGHDAGNGNGSAGAPPAWPPAPEPAPTPGAWDGPPPGTPPPPPPA